MIENSKILVLGMARSGTSVAKLLSKYKNEVIITDIQEQEKSLIEELNELGIKTIILNNQSDLVDESYDYIIKNPAIRKDNPAVVKAKKLGIPVINELEVSFKFLPADVQIIGITGSNGKTTTTTITYEFLKTLNKNVFLGGNIGIPLSSIVENIKSGDILVLEISDHQLCDMYDFKTNISALTNLSEVHLDFHGNYETYKNTKKKIFNHQTEKEVAIINKENDDSLNLVKNITSSKIYFSSKKCADIYVENKKIIYKGQEILNTDDILIKGFHNYENCMIAIVIAKHFGVSNENIKNFLSTFTGVEHRLEFVKNLNGRKFYNDSKSTNNESTSIALDSFQENIILIMGGLDRNIPFDTLSSHLQNVKCILSFGETKEKINEFASKNHITSMVFNSLEEATIKAYELSEKDDIILLSPACASWDQYKDFEIRGKEFKEIVKKLI